MKSITKSLVVGALTLGAASSFAQAVTKPGDATAHAAPGDAAKSKPMVTMFPERITRAEAIKKAEAQFDAVDSNKDGVVTREEIVAFQDKMQKLVHTNPPSLAPDTGPAKK